MENVTTEASRPSPRSVAREADIMALEEEVSTVVALIGVSASTALR